MSAEQINAIIHTVAAVFFAVGVVVGAARHGEAATAAFAWFGGMNTVFALWWWHRWLKPDHPERVNPGP